MYLHVSCKLSKKKWGHKYTLFISFFCCHLTPPVSFFVSPVVCSLEAQYTHLLFIFMCIISNSKCYFFLKKKKSLSKQAHSCSSVGNKVGEHEDIKVLNDMCAFVFWMVQHEWMLRWDWIWYIIEYRSHLSSKRPKVQGSSIRMI